GAELRARQRATILKKAPHLLDRVRWLQGLPEPGFRGVVIANEVIDAMPVTRFRRRLDDVVSLWVHWDGVGFCEEERVIDGLDIEGLDLSALPAGYTSEVCPRAAAWVRALAGICAQAAVLVVDYGFPVSEYYHRERQQGTLMCHYRHRAHSDPYVNIGLQDITAHVDFSAVAAAAVRAGFQVAGYTQLAPFLMALGLADYLQGRDYADDRERIAAVQEFKKLTMPYELGELFKVIGLIKGFDAELTGFSLFDHRGRL
ncbi:MAG: SAM-dependent methyltransferase, partial [Gammaproteobacteria bacterium]|nr:SAM-dependent methyltransferase [Gammaproteobacteria bacterium]